MSKRARSGSLSSEPEPVPKCHCAEGEEEGVFAGLLPELWGEVAGHLSTADQARGLGLVSSVCNAATIPFKGETISLSRRSWSNIRIWEGQGRPVDLERRFKRHGYTALRELSLWDADLLDSTFDWLALSQTRIVDLTIRDTDIRYPPCERIRTIVARLIRITIGDPFDAWRAWEKLGDGATPALRELVLRQCEGKRLDHYDQSMITKHFPTIESLTLDGVEELSANLSHLTALKHLRLRIANPDDSSGSDGEDDRCYDDGLDRWTLSRLSNLETLCVRQANLPFDSWHVLRQVLLCWLPKLRTLDWAVTGHWRLTRTDGSPIEARLIDDSFLDLT